MFLEVLAPTSASCESVFSITLNGRAVYIFEWSLPWRSFGSGSVFAVDDWLVRLRVTLVFFSSAFFFSCPFVSTNVSSLGSCVLGNTSKIESGPMLEKEREKTPVLRDVGFRLAGRSGRLEKSLKRYKAIALGIFGRMWLESLAVDMLLFLWCSGHVS